MQGTRNILSYALLALGVIIFAYGYLQNITQSPLPIFFNSTQQGTFYGVSHMLSTIYATQFMIEGLFFILISIIIRVF
jgi:hypothetical protein